MSKTSESMPPSSQEQRQRQRREPQAGLATLMLVAGAVAGFVWWRRRDADKGKSGAKGSAFKFPKAKPPARTPVEKRANNKKNKKRRAEENERRKEKRERKCASHHHACFPLLPVLLACVQATLFNGCPHDGSVLLQLGCVALA